MAFFEGCPPHRAGVDGGGRPSALFHNGWLGTEALGTPVSEPLPNQANRPQPTPLVHPPVHQASSGGYPPPPHRASLKKRHFSAFFYALETTLRNLLRGVRAPAPPSQPFPDPFCWNQGPWSTPSTRPAPVGALETTKMALGLPPRPPGQLRWVPPPPHRTSFKKRHFSVFAPSTRDIQGHVGCSECRDCRELVKRRGVPEFSWLRTLTRVFSTIRADIKVGRCRVDHCRPNATKRPKQDFFYHLVPQTPPRFEKIVKRRRPPSLTSYLTAI